MGLDVTAKPTRVEERPFSVAQGPQIILARADLGRGNLHGYGMHIGGQML